MTKFSRISVSGFPCKCAGNFETLGPPPPLIPFYIYNPKLFSFSNKQRITVIISVSNKLMRILFNQQITLPL